MDGEAQANFKGREFSGCKVLLCFMPRMLAPQAMLPEI